MSEFKKPQIYRDVIDSLVENCHSGQGQIGPERMRRGVWNPNLSRHVDEHQNDLNKLLERLNTEDREILAKQLERTFQNGVFETLKTLEEFGIEPFTEGYEGSAFHDFTGRVDREEPWEWPEDK